MKKRLIILFLVFFLLIFLPFTAASGGFFHKINNFFGKGITANLISPDCTETDNGRDILVKGYYNMAIKPYDYCTIRSDYVNVRPTGTHVNEKWCNPDWTGPNSGVYFHEDIPCTYGCVDGACVCPEGAEYPCEYDVDMIKYTFNQCSDSDMDVNILGSEKYTYTKAKEAGKFWQSPNYQDSRYTKGTTIGIPTGGSTPSIFTDVCTSSRGLREYGCVLLGSSPGSGNVDFITPTANLYVFSLNQICPFACSNGACVESSTVYSCTKSGKNSTSTYKKYFRGNLVENDVFYDSKTDYCMNSDNLMEYSCYPSSYAPAAGKIRPGVTKICKYGCYDGECVSADNVRAVIPQLQNGWTPWYNQDDPSDGTDSEYHSGWDILPDDCAYITDIECQTTSGESYRKTGEVVSCDKRWGLYCKAQDQPGGACLNDYKVRYKCFVNLTNNLANTCVDTDIPNDPFIYGAVSGSYSNGTSYQFQDECIYSSGELAQYKCENNLPIGLPIYDCLGNCSNGACVFSNYSNYSNASCGNGICEPGEDSTNCPVDCEIGDYSSEAGSSGGSSSGGTGSSESSSSEGDSNSNQGNSQVQNQQNTPQESDKNLDVTKENQENALNNNFTFIQRFVSFFRRIFSREI